MQLQTKIWLFFFLVSYVNISHGKWENLINNCVWDLVGIGKLNRYWRHLWCDCVNEILRFATTDREKRKKSNILPEIQVKMVNKERFFPCDKNAKGLLNINKTFLLNAHASISLRKWELQISTLCGWQIFLGMKIVKSRSQPN